EGARAARDLPARLEEWEREQLRAATQAERAACEALAVLGAGDAPLVAEVSGQPAAEVAAALAGAARRGLVAAEPGGRFRTARPATAQAIDRALEPARRALMHRRAAEAVERRCPPLDPAVALWHRIRAGDADAALAAIGPAIARLRAAGDHAGALALGGAALDLAAAAAPGDPRAAPLAVEVGGLAQLCGD